MPLASSDNFEPLQRRPRRTSPSVGVRPFMPPAPTPANALRPRWNHTVFAPFTMIAAFLRWLLATWRGFVVLATIGLIAGAVGGVYQFVVYSPYFDVVDVMILGARPRLHNELMSLTGLQGRYGVNLLLLDSDELHERLSIHPRVSRLSVEKQYPGTLIIEVDERRATAIVLGSAPYLVDREGVVIGTIDAGEWDAYNHLPALTGVDETTIELGQALNQTPALGALQFWDAAARLNSPLIRTVGEIHVGAEDRLELVMRGGTRVLLDPKLDGLHLAALEEISSRPDGLSGIESLDLRFDSIAVASLNIPPPTNTSTSRRTTRR